MRRQAGGFSTDAAESGAEVVVQQLLAVGGVDEGLDSVEDAVETEGE